MKRIFLTLLLLCAVAFAADHKNVDTQVAQGYDYVTCAVYKIGPFTMSDSIGNYYSKSIPIADMNDSDGYFSITVPDDASGTEDINISYEYSVDGTVWTAGAADANLDQVSTTTVTDTVGIADGANQLLFHTYPLMRVKFDGQAGNPINTITAYAVFIKDTPASAVARPAPNPTRN